MNTYKDPEYRGYYLGKVAAALIVALILVIAIAAAQNYGVTTTPAAALATPAMTAATSALAAVTPATAAATPALESAELSPDGVVTLSGAGEPGSTVELYAGDVKLGSVVAGADGTWSYQGALQPGQYRFVARTVDKTGRTVNESAVMAVSFGPGTAGAAATASAPGETATGGEGPAANVPTTSGPGEIATAAPEAANAPAEGTASTGASAAPTTAATAVTIVLETAAPQPAQTPAAGKPAAGAVPTAEVSAPGTVAEPEVTRGLTVVRATADQAGQVTLTGTGQPGTTIEVIRDGEVTGTVVVKSDGTWSFAYLATPGVQTVAIQHKGEPGSRIAPVRFQFKGTPSVAAVPAPSEAAAAKSKPGAPATSVKPEKPVTGRAYIVREGDYLTKLAARFYGSGAQWQTIYKGTNKKADKDDSFAEIEDPDLIIPGWKLWIPEK